MNTVIPNNPMSAPHLLVNRRLSPSRSDPYNTPTMGGRKRKASEEPDHDRMSTSPSASPSFANRQIAAPGLHRSIKRIRTNASGGRPLPLPRLLETLSPDDMRQLIQNICDQHPDLHHEVVTKAPRPSVESSLSVLATYEDAFRKAFPLGNRPTSDYTYNRVRQHMLQLIEALRDFTPYYLPPQEMQTTVSLAFLDAATNIIHRLPEWDTFQNQRYKLDAYDEISKAWALVIREALKRAGGFHLQMGGWDQKLVDHSNRSGGKLEEAVHELKGPLGFGQPPPPPVGTPVTVGGMSAEERASLRQQLLAGTYGPELGVRPGGW
ncbi:Cut8-domain-containing protein [Polychaeton citri CBS 116435]|uniref:Tethering factor for nuclear proteasome STS1 n=1 Tax=Polychaeton citri CBS 116435 TaxID=1314669 RepID=A0A9P4UK31_9PEZI|nr:Cut8-domain-containing protein [Polychaeton citri CBS 116435]